MSRVRWNSLAKRLRFEYSHTASGRLYSEPAAAPPSDWAVAGGSAFVAWAVPALRKAGANVVALSVTRPEHNLSARLRAQDEQDQLLCKLAVPIGLAPECLHGHEAFTTLLCDGAMPGRVVGSIADAATEGGKTLFLASRSVCGSQSWTLPELIM